MRTTVTLDADTERLIRSAMRARKVGFKTALNDAVRRGLRKHAASAEPRFTVRAKAMHMHPEIDASRIRDVDAALEVEAFRAVAFRSKRARATGCLVRALRLFQSPWAARK